MAQRWKWTYKDSNITDLSSNPGKYVMGNTDFIVFHNNMKTRPTNTDSDASNSQYFVMYMPDSNNYIYATTAIKFHDCYRVDNTGYAHASFAFIAPGYLAGFPLSFGFAGVNKAGSVWSIGQMQTFTQSNATRTSWTANLEISFGWPTEPAGIAPFISVGGVPFYSRYNTSDSSNKTVRGYSDWSGGSEKSYTRSLGTVSSAKTNGTTPSPDEFASNAFNITYNGWDNSDSGYSTSPSGAKALCPVDFSNWVENADSSFMYGWKNTAQEWPNGRNGLYLGCGSVFGTGSTSTYGSPLAFNNVAFSCTLRVWVYNSSGAPQVAKQVYVYDSSGVPKKAKHLYVYNSSGAPVAVF